MIKELTYLAEQCERIAKIKEELYQESNEDFGSGISWGESKAYGTIARELRRILEANKKFKS